MKTIEQKGFSLIELMIAMVIGLFLLGGIVSVFSSSRKSFDLTQDISVVQQSARYSIDEISRSIRLAGFQGCAFEGVAESNVQAKVSPTNNLFLTAIQGAEVSGTNWVPARPAELNGLNPEPMMGSDVLMVQFGSPLTSSLTTAMVNQSDTLILADNSAGIKSGDLAIISDCSTSDIFRVSNVSASTSGINSVVTHTASDNVSGNLSKVYTPGILATANTTTVMKYNFTTYYVANTGRTNTDGDAIYSLYSYDIEAINNDTPATEIIEGIENMQVLYGIRESNGVVRYVPADHVSYTPERVHSIQLALLIASAEASAENQDSKSYDLLGTVIGPGAAGGSTPAHPEDHRIRMAFSSTVKIRNRRQ